MTRLKAAGLDVDLQVLDNEASKDYKAAMVTKWKVKYQLVPPDMYRKKCFREGNNDIQCPIYFNFG